MQVVRQATDVVMRLDRRRAFATTGFDDVGIERALDEEFDLLAVLARFGDNVSRRLLECPDELPTDDLALVLGLGYTREGLEERLRRLDDVQLHAGRSHVVTLDLLGLALAQQAVIDEHAGESVADSTLHERCRHGRVDTAGQAADDALVADLRTDRVDRGFDDVDHRPRRTASGALVQEPLQHLLAMRRVQHLGVELDAV